MNLVNTRMRLERLTDERDRTKEKIEDARQIAEEEKRDLAEFERQQIDRYRARVAELESEMGELADDLQRHEGARDVGALLRNATPGQKAAASAELVEHGEINYRHYGEYARDWVIARYPEVARMAAGHNGDPTALATLARERVEKADTKMRVVANTLTTDIPGLLPPTHMAQIMDIISTARPVVNASRRTPLTSGRMTYPKISQRPVVNVQTTEKTETTSQKMSVTLEELLAKTYLGAGDLSWQAINWSTPNALQLWFDLAAEDYARKTEAAVCSELGTAGGGTVTTPLGTAGTETFAQWRTATIAGLGSIYDNTGGRAQTSTLYLSARRFFQLAALGTDQTLQVSSVGNLDISSMTGTWAGLTVVGSYGFGTNSNAAILGDSSALLVAETPGAPVEMRVVEPAIGGWEVGIIGAFATKIFDATRFIHLS